jgi:6-phosphofructokinase 1
VLLVEVMGRNAGWLALESGIAGGGDVILIPEIPYDIEAVLAVVRKRSRFGKRFSLVVVSEGCRPMGGEQVYQRLVMDSPDPVRLGGISHLIGKELEDRSGIECRVAVLGHLQRGGTPTPLDRILATRLSVKSMELVMESKYNQMVAIQGDRLVAVPIEKVMNRQRLVPLDHELIHSALAVGTSFGAELG